MYSPLFLLLFVSLLVPSQASALDMATLKQLEEEACQGALRCLVVDQDFEGVAQGTSQAPFTSIQAAASLAKPGDVVFVRPGIYREWVQPVNSGEEGLPVRYVGAGRDEVFVRGSELWSPEWSIQPDGLYRAELRDEDLLAGDFQRFKKVIYIGSDAAELTDVSSRPVTSEAESLPLVAGQIFVDGLPLEQVKTREELARPGTWLLIEDGTAVDVNPPSRGVLEQARLEVSVRHRLFASRYRALQHIHVQGFSFEHCANSGPFPVVGAVATRAGRYWRFVNNRIRYAATVGLDIGSEGFQEDLLEDLADETQRRPDLYGGDAWVEDNEITDNGLSGIMGWQSKRSVVRRNQILRNNWMRLDNKTRDLSQSLGVQVNRWVEWGGIKLHHADESIIEHNLVMDNETFGIWLDNDFRNVEIRHNTIVNNLRAGIFIEYGRPPEEGDRDLHIYGNVILGSRKTEEGSYGQGIYTHDASGIRIAHNLIGGHQGDPIRNTIATDRRKGGVVAGASRLQVYANLFFGDRNFVMARPAECLPGTMVDLGFRDADMNVIEVDCHVFTSGNRSDGNHVWLTEPDASVYFKWQGTALAALPSPRAIVAQTLEARGLTQSMAEEYQKYLDANSQQASLALWQAVTDQDLHLLAEHVQAPEFDRQCGILRMEVSDMLATRDAGVFSTLQHADPPREDRFGQRFDARSPAGPFARLDVGTVEYDLYRHTGHDPCPVIQEPEEMDMGMGMDMSVDMGKSWTPREDMSSAQDMGMAKSDPVDMASEHRDLPESPVASDEEPSCGECSLAATPKAPVPGPWLWLCMLVGVVWRASWRHRRA